jgi:hypothetical protein
MTAPLDGIRVVEVANWLAAPAATALMADMGADVITVEPPGGDIYRYFILRSIGYDHEFATNYAFQNGGGIALLDASSASHFQIVDATIASNSSAASSGNGISAVGASAVETDNTIVSGNFSASGLSDLAGTFYLKNCLVQQSGGATITGTSSGNLFGIDPHLSALADHGGPTLTLLPSAASAAVDALDCAVAAFAEQRKFTRCVNGKRDIGSVERQNPEDIIFRNGLDPT